LKEIRIEVTGREEEGVSSYRMTWMKREDPALLKEEALDRSLWRTRSGRDYGHVVRQRDE
jgi:hypothetical protein